MLLSALTAFAAVGAQVANAATAADWRTRTIYQCAYLASYPGVH